MEPVPSFAIVTPFEGHLHLRDGDALATTVPHSAKDWGAAIVMPNLKPAIKTVSAALEYRERIIAAIPPGVSFNPLMTLYLTEETSAEDFHEITASYGKVVACKLYPAGATTNSSEGIPDVEKAYAKFELMEKKGITLCVHGEVTDPSVDVFDREPVFIDRYLSEIVRTFPGLRIVLEHVTTAEGVQFVADCGPNVAASITAHHLLFNRNALFQGGLQPHWYCLPVLKRETHRQALRGAALSNSGKFFAGLDSAPHPKRLKEAPCGCAGCYTAPQGLAAYAQAFDSLGAFDRERNPLGLGDFERFVSLAGPAFYRIPHSTDVTEFVRKSVEVPLEYQYGKSDSVTPLFAGQSMQWETKRISG